MSIAITPAVAGAITAELLTGAIRFYFLWQRMKMLEGLTKEEIEKKFQEALAEFQKRSPEELLRLAEEVEKKISQP